MLLSLAPSVVDLDTALKLLLLRHITPLLLSHRPNSSNRSPPSPVYLLRSIIPNTLPLLVTRRIPHTTATAPTALQYTLHPLVRATTGLNTLPLHTILAARVTTLVAAPLPVLLASSTSFLPRTRTQQVYQLMISVLLFPRAVSPPLDSPWPAPAIQARMIVPAPQLQPVTVVVLSPWIPSEYLPTSPR